MDDEFTTPIGSDAPLLSDPIPRTAAPRCDRCFAPAGQCQHNKASWDKDKDLKFTGNSSVEDYLGG